MTSRREIFEAIARGEGPRDRLLAFGFSGWGPGQLERELDQGGWFVLPGDAEFLFDPAIDSKWDRALARRTIDL
jgi:putative transcriptional regulator